jgi:hypothetical protein
LIGSTQQSGVAGKSVVSPNACLANGGPSGRPPSGVPQASSSPKGDSRTDTPGNPLPVDSARAQVGSGATQRRRIAVTVLDDNGVLIPGIPRANFRILENGVPRQIVDFEQSGPSGKAAADYRISYEPINQGDGAVASAISVELVDTHTKKPLIIKDQKGNLIRYRTVVNLQ